MKDNSQSNRPVNSEISGSFSEERRLHALGAGDWRFFNLPLEKIYEAASVWEKQLSDVEYPWLCWNVDPEWNLVQQRQVKSAGWTPLVGYDPRIGPPPLVRDAVLIDFNKPFGFPTMWMHFPLEFAHLFCKRLAFWHSDLILRKNVAEKYAQLFRELKDGEVAATPDFGNLFRRIFKPYTLRYWEVLGCTTKGASKSQFEQGCGWWKGFFNHPSHQAHPEIHKELQKYYWDNGVGIYYWKHECGGKVIDLDFVEVNEGHCTSIGRKDYVRISPHNELLNLGQDLKANYQLSEVCNRLGVSNLLDQDPTDSFRPTLLTVAEKL
jgi:hypothetical protein